MIDHTSTRIEQQQAATRRHNLRRYAFQRMLQSTDRVLWLLEEMNRDGVKVVPKPIRAEIREVVEAMPNAIAEPLRDNGGVQDTSTACSRSRSASSAGATPTGTTSIPTKASWASPPPSDSARSAAAGRREKQVGAVGGQ